MDVEGGKKAMAALNGVKLMGSPRPLSVQTYVSYSSNVCLLPYKCILFPSPPEITDESFALSAMAEPQWKSRQCHTRSMLESMYADYLGLPLLLHLQ